MRDRKITHYDHIVAKCLDQIPLQVQNAIENGWQPYSGAVKDEGNWWHLPIVKYHYDDGEV